MEKIIEIFTKIKFLLIFLAILFLSFISVKLFSQQKSISPPTEEIPTITPVKSLLPTISVEKQKQFKIIDTYPKSEDQNVDTGEITISFKTDGNIISKDSFSLVFIPPLPYYFKIEDNFPTKEVKANIYGGLKTNTEYTATILDKNKVPIYSWRFKTSSKEPESSSGLTWDERNKTVDNYYPLFESVPYSTKSFDIDYTDRLTLKVVIKNPNIEAVKKEVIDWIKSKGVDPNTHIINYINQF